MRSTAILRNQLARPDPSYRSAQCMPNVFGTNKARALVSIALLDIEGLLFQGVVPSPASLSYSSVQRTLGFFFFQEVNLHLTLY